MIEKILIVSFIVIAIWVVMLPGMLFSKLGDYGDKHFPDWVKHMTFDCPICMAGGYGSVIYWLIYGNNIKEWLVVILAAMGFITIFVKMKRN